ALGRISLMSELAAGAEEYQIHPALLDAGLQVLGAAMSGEAGSDQTGTYLPVGLKRFTICAAASAQLWAYAQLHASADDSTNLIGDVRLLGDDGQLVAEITALQLKWVTRAAGDRQIHRTDEQLYEVVWEAQPAAAVPSLAPGSWLLWAAESAEATP